ncbi:uncharacterized protein LOC135944870 [Cloeon dipterum]|uniref:uncharacterized protein LOC135944870 n=1 Tax=Cloeon dipterum TaxID=197152 RepID=UPI00321FF0E2
MLSKIVVVGVVLCCSFFLMVVVQGQAVVTDADPSEYPYLVRIHVFYPGVPLDITLPGMVVSSKFVLTTIPTSFLSSYNFTMTDQFGEVRPHVKIGPILDGRFTYSKVCNKFRGAKYPLRESDFKNVTDAIPDAQLLSFNITSPVLRKVTVPVMSNTDCATATASDAANITNMCVDVSGFTDLCQVFSYKSIAYESAWGPMLAIGGQVQGLPSSNSGEDSCNGSYWQFANLAVYRQNLTTEIPEVDIF